MNNYYNVSKKQQVGNHIYDSKFEAAYAQELELRVKAKDIKSFDTQVNLDLNVNGCRVCQYRIDFVVHHNDGTTEYVECKGFPTDVWKLKWKLFEALYHDKPKTKLTIVYQSNRYKAPKLRKIK